MNPIPTMGLNPLTPERLRLIPQTNHMARFWSRLRALPEDKRLVSAAVKNALAPEGSNSSFDCLITLGEIAFLLSQPPERTERLIRSGAINFQFAVCKEILDGMPPESFTGFTEFVLNHFIAELQRGSPFDP